MSHGRVRHVQREGNRDRSGASSAADRIRAAQFEGLPSPEGRRMPRSIHRGIGKADSSAYPIGWGHGPSGRMLESGWHRPSFASDPPGHPARGRTRVVAGLLARGSLRLSGLPDAFGTSDTRRQPLAAYSCGGSSGITASRGAPDSLLAADPWRIGRTTTATPNPKALPSVNRTIALWGGLTAGRNGSRLAGGELREKGSARA